MNLVKYLNSFLIIFLLLCNPLGQIHAQGRQDSDFELLRPSEYKFQNFKDQELIAVRLLGAVTKAGLYHIPKNLTLATLLSLAGGPTPNANLQEVIITNDQETYKRHNTYNFVDSLETGDPSPYTLKPHDIILLKKKRPFISSDTWRFVTIGSVLLTSVLTALAIDDRI